MTFLWTITSPVAISLPTPADQSNNEGATVSLTSISATDSTSGTIVYGAIGLPGGLSISSSNGHITGTVASGAAANGPYTVQVFATDGTYVDTRTFPWTIGISTTVTLTHAGAQGNN